MGIIYELYNHKTKEYTNFHNYKVNTKRWVFSPLANFYFYITNGNNDWELIDDMGDAHYNLRETYTDKTDEMVKDYNEYCDVYPNILERIEHR